MVFYLNFLLVAAFPGVRSKLRHTRLELSVDCHVVMEESMASDMFKSDFFLYKLKLFKILLLKGKTHAACTNAVKGVVVE